MTQYFAFEKQTNKKNQRYNLGWVFATKAQYKDIFSLSIVAVNNRRGILKLIMTPCKFLHSSEIMFVSNVAL